MFREESTLCCQILRQHFGPIVEKLGFTILQRKRVNLGFILKESGLSKQNVRQALVVLIQHSIATYFETPENRKIVVYYSINKKNLLRRTRIGLYLAIIEERFGKTGFEIARLILMYGLLSFNQISRILLKNSKTLDDVSLHKKIMLMLVKDRTLVAATKEQFLEIEDIKLKMESDHISTYSVPPTAKQLETIRASINGEIKVKANSRVIYGTKRKALNVTNGDSSSSKRHRLDGGGVGEEELDDMCPFYLSFDRMDVFLRNLQLSLYMEQATNLGGSTVMKTLLGIAEQNLKSCYDNKTITISTAQVVERLPPEAKIQKLIILDNANDFNPYNSDSKSRRNDHTAECVYSFLELMVNDKSSMLVKTDGNGPGQYYVDFERGVKAVRKQQLNSFVRGHLGIESLRLLNILSEHDYVDDKTLAKIGMMLPTKCREKLVELAILGFIEIQEIHKSSDRAPIRTIYLYSTDHNRQRAAMLKLLYSFSSKLIQRCDYEIMLKQNLLLKCNRDDVSLDLSLLSASDKESLSELETSSEKIQVSLLRVDSIILIFRDALL